MEDDEAPGASLPCSLVKAIAQLAVQQETGGSRLLVLLSLCGVCQQWRTVCSEVAGETALAFDGLETAPPAPGSGAMMARFRKTPLAKKTAVFESGARLLKGYTEVSLSGDAVSDAALAALAAANGARLTSLRLHAAGRVTDAGLSALLAAAPRLRSVHLSDLGPGARGGFLPALLGSCRRLQALHLSGVPGMDWAGIDWAAAPPPVAEAAPAARHRDGQVNAHQPGQQQQQQEEGQQQQQQQQGRRRERQRFDEQGAAAAAAAAEAEAEEEQQQREGGEAEGTEEPWPASLGALAAPSSSARGPALSPPPSPMQQAASSSLSAAADEAEALAREAQFDSRPGGGAGARGGAGASSGGSGGGSSSGDGAGASTSSGGGSCRGTLEAEAEAELAAPPPLLSRPPRQSQQSQGEEEEEGEGRAPSPPSPPPPPPPLATLTRLHARGMRLDGLPRLLAQLPCLADLELDGPAINIQFASVTCPRLRRLSYAVESPGDLDEALWSFTGLAALRTLEIVAKGPPLMPDQLRVLGMLPLTELRLDSWAFKQQPTLSRPAFSHVTNEGVKALVDAICARMVNSREVTPLKLSLAGATTVNHEAVSALLRLPVLTELDIAGCAKITPMDKMRLVAKVKAGREFVRSKS